MAGAKEDSSMLPLMAQWRDALRAAGVPAAHLAYHAAPDGEHREWFWQRESGAAYEWLFEPRGRPVPGAKPKP